MRKLDMTNHVVRCLCIGFYVVFKVLFIVVYTSLYNSWLTTILYFINVEDQLNSKNLQIKFCVHFPKFQPQYSLKLSVLYSSIHLG